MWVLLAKEGIARNPNLGFQRKTRRFWSVVEALPLDKNLHISVGQESPHFRWTCSKGLNRA